MKALVTTIKNAENILKKFHLRHFKATSVRLKNCLTIIKDKNA